MKIITEKGGEGLMLKDPNSYYENKRTNKLLKIKHFHDAEAEIVDHLKGKGKYENVLGAYLCKNLTNEA